MSESQVIALSSFPKDVARALSKRGEAMLVAPDLKAQVARTTPLELFFLVKELGSDEAMPLLLAASQEQVQALCDLDCWANETFSPTEWDAWLAAFLPEGKQALADAFLKLDEEVQVLFLADSVEVWDHRSDSIPDALGQNDDAPFRTLPGGFMTVVARDHTHEREVEPLVLIDALVGDDLQNALRLLTAAKWELHSALEEEALRFRTGRLADMGFVAAHEAASLLRPLALPQHASLPLDTWASRTASDVVFAGGDALQLPALYAQSYSAPDSVVVMALAHVHNISDLKRLEGELVAVINATIVCWGQRLNNMAAMQDMAALVRDTLSLGLCLINPEAVKTHDVETLAHILVSTPLSHVFRHGIQPALHLSREARRILEDPVVNTWLQRPGDAGTGDDQQGQDAADRAFLRGLVAPRPVWAGQDVDRPHLFCGWADPKDIEACRLRLEDLAQKLA